MTSHTAAMPVQSCRNDSSMADMEDLEREISKLRKSILGMPTRLNHKEEMIKADHMRRLGEMIEEKEQALEHRRIEEVVRIEEERHPPRKDECPICMESIRPDLDDTVARFLCCGQCTCTACCNMNKMRKCPLCRSRFPNSEKEFEIALVKLAKGGKHAWAMLSASHMYAVGEYGVKADKNEAMKWCYKAAEHGSVSAMQKLGEMFYSGDESLLVEQSYSDAQIWLQRAADLGDPDAQVLLGMMHYRGDGGTQNRDEAVRLLSLAVSQEQHLRSANRAACLFYLGNSFRTGEGGLQKSLERAKFYFSKLSVFDGGEAQFLLGVVLFQLSCERYCGKMTLPGHNCLPQVLALYRRALANGCHHASDKINEIESLASRYCNACQRSAEQLPPSEKLRKCLRCKASWYCSIACQKQDWRNGHKVDCCKSPC